MLLLQVLTEYVKAVPERKAAKDALAKEILMCLGMLWLVSAGVRVSGMSGTRNLRTRRMG